jgi:hypothetical protein
VVDDTAYVRYFFPRLAFRGARKLLTEDRPVILSELHPSQLMDISRTTPAEFVPEIEALNYRCFDLVAVGMSIARHPPHRPVRALLTHTVLTLDIWRRSAQWDMGGAHESQEASGPDAP